MSRGQGGKIIAPEAKCNSIVARGRALRRRYFMFLGSQGRLDFQSSPARLFFWLAER